MKINFFRLHVFTILALLIITASNSQNVNVSSKAISTLTKNGFTITILNKDKAINSTLEKALINTFHKVYPKMVKDFNLNAYRVINVTIDSSYKGVAFANADTGKITVSSEWLNKKPQDTDLLTHELMHIVQSYPSSSLGWLTEGIADYARNKYGINNNAAAWSLPLYSEGQNYTDAYRVTAAFLTWVEINYNESLVSALDSRLRNGKYSPELWIQLTGLSLSELWEIYAEKNNKQSQTKL